MSPILVPTLAELGIELDRAYGRTLELLAQIEPFEAAGAPINDGHPLDVAFNAACAQGSDAAHQIIALAAQTPTDWQVKAKAYCWFTYGTTYPPAPDPMKPAEHEPADRIANQMAQAMLSGEVWK